VEEIIMGDCYNNAVTPYEEMNRRHQQWDDEDAASKSKKIKKLVKDFKGSLKHLEDSGEHGKDVAKALRLLEKLIKAEVNY
jgi:hypothetical protein